MPWMRTDDTFETRHEVEQTSDAALGLLWRAMTYCARNLTDGRVHDTWVRLHVRGGMRKRAARELVEHGWWRADGESYVIVAYLDPASPICQPSAAEVGSARDKERRKKADQRARGRQAVLPWAEPDAAVSPGDSPGIKPPTPSTPLQEDPHTPASGGEHGGLWRRIKEHLHGRVDGRVLYWLDQAEATEFADDTLTIRAPRYVADAYAQLLTDTASEIEARDLRVVVAESEEERSERIRKQAGEQRKDRRAERALKRTQPNEAA